MSGCLNEWMDELKERGNRPRRRGGEENEGEEDEDEEDEDEVEGRGNRREEENKTTLPEEEECIDIKKAKYRLRIHGLTTVQNSTVQNSTQT